MPSVTHVITGTQYGGAEMMLFKLLSSSAMADFDVRVVSLWSVGPVGEKIRRLGVPIESLGMRRGVPRADALPRLVRLLRSNPTDVMQTWMYHSDLLGGLAGKLVGVPVAWGLRTGILDPLTKSLTRMTVRACAALSSTVPTRIIACGESVRRIHIGLGYDASKICVIPNGFDLEAFSPNGEARAAVRAELGFTQSERVVGLVARFDPMKDHRTFVRAAALLSARLPGARFILCGPDMTWDNQPLAAWIREAGLQDRFSLLGPRGDVPRVTCAFDLATSSSRSGEGFPNVIGEAMACGVPCVVTDVGDAGLLVGDTGRVVPPEDAGALASAWHDVLMVAPEERAAAGAAARNRVAEHFSLPSIAERYAELYRELAHHVRHRRLS